MDSNEFFKQPGAELRGQIRCGRVSSSDAKAHTAQVQFFEQDGFVSHDMQILVTRPGDYSVYEKDALVLCILIDGIQGFGFVLGALYSESDDPPLNDKGARSVASDDLRLGAPDAEDKAALAPKCNDNDTALWDVLNGVFGSESAVINDTFTGLPHPIYVAVKAAIVAQQLANKLPPVDVAAEKVKIK